MTWYISGLSHSVCKKFLTPLYTFCFLNQAFAKIIYKKKKQGLDQQKYKHYITNLTTFSSDYLYQSNVTSPMSKTSDFPIDVWECQNVLDMIQKVKFSSENLFLIKFKIFWHSQNEIGFSKRQMGIQKFRSRINSSINIYNWITKMSSSGN